MKVYVVSLVILHEGAEIKQICSTYLNANIYIGKQKQPNGRDAWYDITEYEVYEGIK